MALRTTASARDVLAGRIASLYCYCRDVLPGAKGLCILGLRLRSHGKPRALRCRDVPTTVGVISPPRAAGGPVVREFTDRSPARDAADRTALWPSRAGRRWSRS